MDPPQADPKELNEQGELFMDFTGKKNPCFSLIVGVMLSSSLPRFLPSVISDSTISRMIEGHNST